MHLCKIAKIVLLFTLIGMPLSLVFGGGAALVLTILIVIYTFESNDKHDKKE